MFNEVFVNNMTLHEVEHYMELYDSPLLEKRRDDIMGNKYVYQRMQEREEAQEVMRVNRMEAYLKVRTTPTHRAV